MAPGMSGVRNVVVPCAYTGKFSEHSAAAAITALNVLELSMACGLLKAFLINKERLLGVNGFDL
jgi:hypothetical protein